MPLLIGSVSNTNFYTKSSVAQLKRLELKTELLQDDSRSPNFP